jgi:4-amino-4-deoxy-L-arabinose transferase-like glycosyltransferase
MHGMITRLAARFNTLPTIVWLLPIGLLASILLISNLGNHYLWQDEAQTALISKTVLQGGLPRGFDGTNYFSQELGAEYGEGFLYKWHPWLPFYILAAFFKIFGTSTFVARLPFALFGVATVLLVYRLGALLSADRRTGLISALLLSLSVPFLLLSRQCRYYAPAMFFCTAVLACHLRAMEDDRKVHSALQLLSLVLLFHTHQLFFAIAAVSTVTHSALFCRSRLKQVVMISAVALLLNVPWMLWVYNADYRKVYPAAFGFARALSFLGGYLVLIYRHLFGPLFLSGALLAGFLLWRKPGGFRPMEKSAGRRWALPGIFLGIGLLAVSAASFGLFFRYLAPLVPAVALVAGGVIGALAGWSRLLAAGLVVCNLALGPIAQYLYEIRHDYDGPIKGIVTYLNAHAARGDVVAVSYGDLPIKWYTGLRVVGGLTGEPLDPAKDARWVIFRKYTISNKDRAVKTYLTQHLDRSRYEKITLDFPDLAFENREDPDLHRYRTVTDESRVVIYRRIP